MGQDIEDPDQAKPWPVVDIHSEEAGVEDPDLEVHLAVGPGVARAIHTTGSAGAELDVEPAVDLVPATRVESGGADAAAEADLSPEFYVSG